MTPATCTRQIQRKHSLTASEFQREHLDGTGMPVIVTDAMDGWPARNWSFDLFRERYGWDGVIVTDRLGRARVKRKVLLREFVDYIHSPESTELGAIETTTPLYMNHYSPFVAHPELLDDFQDPYFIENWFRTLTGPAADWYNEEFGWVFIGPSGTVTPLHRDLFGTHAWLGQIEGRKRVFLFPPSDAPYLEGDELNPLDPDLENFPLYEQASPLDVELSAGEVLFIPANWFHYVVSLDKSITLTFNFVNQSNFAAHLLAVAADLPNWTKKVDKPRLRSALDIRWTCKGWETGR